jgi:hypothetical protein
MRSTCEPPFLDHSRRSELEFPFEGTTRCTRAEDSGTARRRICTPCQNASAPLIDIKDWPFVCPYDAVGGPAATKAARKGSTRGACRSSAMTVDGTTFDRRATSFVRWTRGMIPASPIAGHGRCEDCYSLDWQTATPIVSRVIIQVDHRAWPDLIGISYRMSRHRTGRCERKIPAVGRPDSAQQEATPERGRTPADRPVSGEQM